ncbi:MAG TPA: hypothetical protein PKH19_04230, partial [Candidatus Syntrophosphaera sp.]|nr:hypothetical protein [Candidatus Syntrophosphaera sp.]
MKTVLYIVYYYPPVGGSGVQRGVKFSRYLPDHGWQSVILTPHPALVKHPKDPSLLADLPPGQTICRSFCLDARWLFKLLWGLRLPGVVNWLRYHVFIPDAEILWLPFARRKIRQILRRHRIDAGRLPATPDRLAMAQHLAGADPGAAGAGRRRHPDLRAAEPG